MIKPIFSDELVHRHTLEQDLMLDPERMLAYMAVTSLSVALEGQSRHYNGFGVAAVLPAYDDEGNPKLLAASNYRPDPETTSNDIRVCAEQALLDNSVHEGDLATGLLVVRGPKPDPKKPIVGCREGAESLHLCRPCRARILTAIGPELLVVTFNDDDPEPAEAMTLGQMLGYHDAGAEYPQLPEGKSARDVALQALKNNKRKNRIPIVKPNVPRRRIKASERKA